MTNSCSRYKLEIGKATQSKRSMELDFKMRSWGDEINSKHLLEDKRGNAQAAEQEESNKWQMKLASYSARVGQETTDYLNWDWRGGCTRLLRV